MAAVLHSLPAEQRTILSRYREYLVEEALGFVGHPSVAYRGHERGRTPEDGFDCSGFVTYLLEKIDFPKPPEMRHVSEYFDRFGILVHTGLHDAGDLVFWSWNGYRPQHIGIVVSSTECVAASGFDGGLVERFLIESSPMPVTGSGNHRQNYNQTLIGFKRLAIPREGRRLQQVD